MEAKEQAKAKASECPVCLDIYVDPRILPACGHTVCFACVRKLIDVPPSRSCVVCPECRETSRVPKNGFLKNFRLSDVVAEFQAGVACGGCQRSAPKYETFRCESCRTDANNEEDIVLCGFCATKHLKANKEHDLVEYGMASKRDIDEVVRQINAEEPTYLNLTIACGLNKVNELTRKAKEAAQRCELAAETIRDELLGREDLTREALDASKRHAVKLRELVLRSQSEVLNAIKECEKSIEDQIKKCDSTVTAKCFATSGSANATSDQAAGPSTSNAALPSTSSATQSNASCQNRVGVKRKLPAESDSSDDEAVEDFYETMARIRRLCDLDIVDLH